MTVNEIVADAVNTIIRGWDENDAEAGQEAQQAQNPDAWFEYMQCQIEAVVGGAVDECTKELRTEVKSVLEMLDNLAELWGDEVVFRNCRDRLRVVAKGGA